MRISGRRSDGAFHLSLGGGLSVILKGDKVSKAVDETLIARMGPWHPADNQLSERRRLTAKMELATLAPLESFSLGMSFDEQRERVVTALKNRLGIPINSYSPGMDLYIPMNGLGEDWVVYCYNGKHFGIDYSISESGEVQFDGNPGEVRPSWELVNSEAEEQGENFGAYVETNDSYKELKQTMWFKKFMANKKKMLGGKKANLDHGPESTEKDEHGGMMKKKDMTVELPGSLPDMNKSV